MFHCTDSEITPLPDCQLRELIAHFDILYERLMLARPISNTAEVEVSRPEARVLTLLGNKGAMTMSDLARSANLALSSATNTVDRLVNKDLVDRFRVDGDRRVVQVRLTSKGETFHDLLLDCRREMGRSMLDALSPGEREIFLELMAKMTGPVPSPGLSIQDYQPAIAD